MARIKLDIPATRALIQVKIPVRITDINYGNHVGNDSFVAIIHEARMRWLAQHNFTEINFGGTGLIMSEIAVEFKSQSIYGDIIDVNIFAGEITRVSFELFYKLSTQRNHETIVLAHAKTGMICFNYENKKVVSIPESGKKIMGQNGTD